MSSIRTFIKNTLLISALGLTLTSCSLFTRKNQEQQQEPKEVQAAAAETAPSTAAVDLPPEPTSQSQSPTAEAIQVELIQLGTGKKIPQQEKTENHHEVHHHEPAKDHATHTSTKSVSPEKSLGWLKNGNVRYLKNRLRSDGQSLKDIRKLASGQAPHAIVVSCSDSRVPPEILFDQKLGEIFVVRSAGQALSPENLGSMEYAVEHLGTQHIVVLGHTSCGAVKAALDTMDGQDLGSPNLNALVKDLHPRLASFKGTSKSAHLHEEVWSNAMGVADDLRKRSKILDSAVQNHKLKISTAVYSLDSGQVEFRE